MIEPFIAYDFMQRALVIVALLSLMLPPLGLFVMSRRMSLMGDAISHALLPGIVLGVMIGGNAPLILFLGALMSGLCVALLTPWLEKRGHIKQEAAFAALTLFFLSLGIALLPLAGTKVDVTHILFGQLFAIENATLYLVTLATIISVIFIVIFFNRLVYETFDPFFMQLQGFGRLKSLFLGMVILALTASFQASGTLLTLGFMLIPALCARAWSQNIKVQILLAIAFSMISSVFGLLLSFHLNLTPSASLILIASGFYLLTLVQLKH